MRLGVTYTVWIPDGARPLRAVIVHQHGCGPGACEAGATAAHDLHWQALARKWDCALLAPSYHQKQEDECRLWCDPRNGSGAVFLRALGDLAARTSHPELEHVPWCLWGHSGGGFWASLMQTLHPDRIAAAWLRSGTAFAAWMKGDIEKPDVPDATFAIPTICNPGVRERDHPRFGGAWIGALDMVRAYSARGAPIGFAPDPNTAHECGDSRYLAIPFFDVCLEMRLPARDARDQTLRPVDRTQSWHADPLGHEAHPGAAPAGARATMIWLPDARVAKAWVEYVVAGEVADATPPPAPTDLDATVRPDGTVDLAWHAHADIESGLQAFIIRRDGREIGRCPDKPSGRFGKPLFQALTYHDTPKGPLPEMRYHDATARTGTAHEYRVVAVNSAGLHSTPSAAARTQ